MKTLEKLGFLIAAGVASLITSVSAEDMHGTSIAVTSGDSIREAGWTMGNLSIVVESPNKIEKSITLSFKGVRKQSISSLTLTTTDWKADLSKYAQGLPSPFPTRAILTMGPWDPRGTISGITISLPYRGTPKKESEQGECLTLDLAIICGQVTTNSISHQPDQRCTQ